MELFRIYYLPQLLIDLYQPHLCLCTDDEPAVFQSDSHDDTAVQPPVSGIILQDATKRIHLEPPVSVGGAAAVIIRDAPDVFPPTPQAMYGPTFSEAW